jgi:hypothetical protein
MEIYVVIVLLIFIVIIKYYSTYVIIFNMLQMIFIISRIQEIKLLNWMSINILSQLTQDVHYKNAH